MAKNEKKKNIELYVADVGPIGWSCVPDDEPEIRKVEELVNITWKRWMKVFGENTNPHELLARIVVQFARLYYRSAVDAEVVEQALAEMEQRLNNNLLQHGSNK